MLGIVYSKPSPHRGRTVRETLWLGCTSKACEAMGLIGLPNWPMGRGLENSLSLTKLPWNLKWLYEVDLTLREKRHSEHASSGKGLSHLIGSKLIVCSWGLTSWHGLTAGKVRAGRSLNCRNPLPTAFEKFIGYTPI